MGSPPLAPRSLVQPWLIVSERELVLPNEDGDPLGPKPRIPYFEFHGLGSPLSLDVGSGGDVYIDLTPGAFALWGNTANGWKRWLDMGSVIGTSYPSTHSWFVRHPYLDYILWIYTKDRVHRIGWFKNCRRIYYTALDSRRWAMGFNLFTMVEVGGRKNEETAKREAAAMLGVMENLARLPKFPAWAKPQSDRPSTSSLGTAAATHVPDHRFAFASASRAPSKRSVKLEPNSLMSEPQIDPPTLAPHPYFVNPHPKSLVQPQITASLERFFTDSLPPAYPYHLPPGESSGFRVPYLQLCGRGPPTQLDIGAPGDVYLDATPGAYALYGKTAAGWARWLDREEPLPVERSGRAPKLAGRSLGGGDIARWYKNTESARVARSNAYKLGIVEKTGAGLTEEVVVANAAKILEYGLVSPGVTGSPLLPEETFTGRAKGEELDLDGLGPFSMGFGEEPDPGLDELGPFSMCFN
ncbi:hypothetical protein C8R46DRAFT_1351520 [Mycena filopes]|nr:hypothetical protein C8R46DRAFT_1351520 [Mycena filopes]